MGRLWKLLKIVLIAILTWFILALLWAFLPFPSWEHEGDNGSDYATSVLSSGKTLTRVYDLNNFHIDSNERSSFALDYKFDPQTLDLFVSGSKMFKSILNVGNSAVSDFGKTVNIAVRTGDTDGANLPWFKHADAVLLYWWIHRDTIQVPLQFIRMEDARGGNFELTLRTSGYPIDDLLSITMRGNDTSTIKVIVPEIPLSSSPSMTYPMRIVLLALVAPVAVFVNEALSLLSDTIGTFVVVVFGIAMYGFLIGAVIVSFWRCVGGYSLDETVGKMKERLERLKDNRRLRWLPVDRMKEGIDVVYRNKRVLRVIEICRDGWHPERDALRAAEEEECDVEKGDIERVKDGDGVTDSK